VLKGVDPAGNGHHESEPAAKDEIEHYRSQLAKLQSLLYAEHKRSILIVLQAMDAGGKDGLINHVLSALNPARCAG
jgi:polyphosphate kinase 2 (PPK2 family)